MSDPKTRLIGQIVTDILGETAATVATDIASFSVKTMAQIVGTTNLSIRQVRAALAILLQHNMVTCSDKRKPGTMDYTIQMDKIIAYLRNPSVLYLVKTTQGDEAEIIVEEMIKSGADTETNILFKTAKRLQEALGKETPAPNISDLHAKFCGLIKNNIIGRIKELGGDDDTTENPDEFRPVEVDIKAISLAVGKKGESMKEGPDKDVMWRLKIDKCDLLLRNKMIVAAAARRLDDQAGKVVSSLLKIFLKYGDAPVSKPFSHLEISEQVASDHGKDSLAHIYLDQYLRVLGDDKTRFVDRVGDSGGGQFQVDMKHIITSLVEASMDCVVLEKFSSKAVRIFRYIREKRYVEEGQLQQVVMIPAKETKLLTYQLLENHFIHLQELRKSVAPTAPAKSFHLFYCDLAQVVRTTLSVCYKAMYNCRDRAKFEAVENARLLDKHERVESIAASLRENGGTEEQLEEVAEMMTPPEIEAVRKIQLKLDNLSKAQIQADETLLLLKQFLHFKLIT